MNLTPRSLLTALTAAAALSVTATTIQAQQLFFDDFEDRVRDQPTVGNNWTWYDQLFDNDDCTGQFVFGFGPFDTEEDDYVAANRNYWTASTDQGGDGNYYRAGLEVPAWIYTDENGNQQGALSSMLRVYGNVFATSESCQRTLVFQEMDVTEAGPYSYSFEWTQDQFGAPVNGEKTFGFVKVLKSSDFTYDEILFETFETTITDTGARLFEGKIDFVIPDEFVGELMQFGFYNDVTIGLGHTFATAGAYYDNISLEKVGIGPGHSGSYFNAAQSGHGFAVEFGYSEGAPIGVVYWYTYDDEGNNVWLIGIGTPDGDRLEVDFTHFSGMLYGQFETTSPPADNVAGTGVFEFTSRDTATFNYTPNMYANMEFGHSTSIEDLELDKIFDLPADDKYIEASAD
jgi:hypothetical protein